MSKKLIDETQWNKIYNNDILVYTDKMIETGKYYKYPHTHRFKSSYHGKAPISNDDQERFLFLKFCFMMFLFFVIYCFLG